MTISQYKIIAIRLNTGRSYGAKIKDDIDFYKQLTPMEFGFIESR
jgi:hypothetical protein